MVYWLRKSPCFEFFGYGKYGLFWAKKLVEIWYLLITETFVLWTFRGGGKYSLSLRQRFNGKMIFTDYWNVLVLKFSGMGNTVFFWGKKFMERWYFLITEKFLFWASEKFLFWTFLWWEIFTWSFSAFHDISWYEKYGFSCSVFTDIITDNIFPTKDYTYS